MLEPSEIQRLADLDRRHVWHPFTPMRQWREAEPIVIVEGEGDWLVDARGRRYLDGVSSIWCNVHGHRHPKLDGALKAQIDRIAHSTLLGLTNAPAAELAGRLVDAAPAGLQRVFYSDAGATATEVGFKMAVGHWHHTGQPQRDTFIALEGAYHGDTTGAMSIGYAELFHRPFKSMVFHVEFVEAPDPCHSDVAGSCCQRSPGAVQCPAAQQVEGRRWSTECRSTNDMVRDVALRSLEKRLEQLGDRCAGVVIEPLVQGAAGMIVQPEGYVRGVAELCRRFGTLLLVDEVATGFGRTGEMFAVDHEGVEPDIMALGKGITAGYMPLAATLCTDRVAEAFEGELHEMKTLFHGHTYTGNPLGCAVALASLDLFEEAGRLAEARRKAERLARRLDPLRDRERFPFVADVRQQGLMVGIELAQPGRAPADTWLKAGSSPGASPTGGGTALGDFGESPDLGRDGGPPRRLGYEVCMACTRGGVFVRPLGDVVILMPPLSIEDENLDRLADTVVDRIGDLA